jgi:uncharacterized protein YdiU (UPF0061 family)
VKTLHDIEMDTSYLSFPESFYHKVLPKPLKNTHLISFNPHVAELLDLDPCQVKPSELIEYFGSAKLLRGSEPLAMKYSGHQFGVYNPELGDGRGVLLGEIVNRLGERWDLHLKGAGQTAYSRFGDGRAVLRSSIREYLISEAMHALKIPTTRALCLLGSEEYTLREGMEPCALVVRVTQSHIRFGHFEHLYHTRRYDDLKALADYCVERYFAQHLVAPNPYLAMFEEIRDRSIDMVARWQAYGFVHGVLNTDNMSILGETFDYGPYAFMDEFRLDYVSNHTDHQGRYAFQRQPDIVLWNLSCLAQTLLPLVDRESLIELLDGYAERYRAVYYQLMRERLGLLSQRESDVELIDQLIRLAASQRIDLNRFLRDLSQFDESTDEGLSRCLRHFKHPLAATDWMLAYSQRIDEEQTSDAERHQQMLSINPCYLLRSYMLEEAIREAHQGDYRLVNTLLKVVREPFFERCEYADYAGEPPDWASGICLSCSS